MVNSDEAEELNIEYEIEGVPTIIAFNRDEKMTVFDSNPHKIQRSWAMTQSRSRT